MVEASKQAFPDIVRMAIHEVVDSILDRVEHPSNLDVMRIHVEHLAGFKDYDIDHNEERTVHPAYRVEARGLTQHQYLKEENSDTPPL